MRKKNTFFLIFTILFCLKELHSQVGNTIPINRKVNWETVGYHRSPEDNLPTEYVSIIEVLNPDEDPLVNYQNIIDAITQASNLSSSTNRILVQLQEGEYTLNQDIVLSPDNNYITIRGRGSDKTTIRRIEVDVINPDIEIPKNEVFIIQGRSNSIVNPIINYDKINNKIILENSISNIIPETFIDIRVKNGYWCDKTPDSTFNCIDNNKNFLGQIVQIEAINANNKSMTLKDDLSIFWDIINKESISNMPFIKSFIPAQEIGIEDLRIVTDSIPEIDISNIGINNVNTIKTKFQHYNIYIENAVNCWINNVNSLFTKNQHIQITKSSSIEVRNSYFYNAQNHGDGGHGYGILITNRSTNCLIENNIFQSLRHSIMVANSANRNVFGYNYSRESLGEYNGAYNSSLDISIHGFYPYGNLFEGNKIDEILVDKVHGSNGPFNTLFRNYSYYNKVELQSTENTNILGNESKLLLDSDSEIGLFDIYGNNNSVDINHENWNENYKQQYCLGDISYYHQSKPEFLSQNFTWPPLGPPTVCGSDNSQTIPARERFISEGYCESTLMDCNSVVESNNLSNATSSEWALEKQLFAGDFYMSDALTPANYNRLKLVACKTIYLKPGFHGKPEENNELRFEICTQNQIEDVTNLSKQYQNPEVLSSDTTNQKNHLTVFPNPSKGIFYLELSSSKNQDPILLSLLDISGRELFQIKPTNQSFQIDISNQTNGIYFLKEISNNKIKTTKLLKY